MSDTRFMSIRDLIEMQRMEQQRTNREQLEGGVQRALQHANRREPTEADKSLAKSFVKHTDGHPADVRSKLPNPPKGMMWGGSITTDRDAAYCWCGHLKEEHNEEHKGCACKVKFTTEKGRGP